MSAKKIIQKFLFEIFYLTVKIRIDLFTALILVVLTKRFPQRNSEKKIRILCLSKSVFNDDVLALSHRSTKVEYLLFPRLLLFNIFQRYIKFDETIWQNYHLSSEFDDAKKKIREHYKSIFSILLRFLKFDAILSGNFVYISQQEFARVASEFNIPLIILYKEGMAPVNAFEEFIKTYKNKIFIADKILFYNESIAEAMAKGNIKGFDKNKSAVVGIPRLDKLVERSHRFNGKKFNQVVLFSFYQKDKMPSLYKDLVDFTILEMRSDSFHMDMIRFAERHPEIKVVIKTKVGNTYKDYIKELIFNNSIAVEKIHNLVISSDMNAQQLVLESDFILGYMSTTLLEALAAGKKIICPYFYDLNDVMVFDYFREHPEFVNYYRSYNDLEQFIIHGNGLHEYSSEHLQDFLFPYIYKTDGKVAERVETEIIKCIGKNVN